MPDKTETLQALSHAAIDCLVTANLIASVIDRYPEEVQENFVEKVDNLVGSLVRETTELQGFAEGWDDSVDEDN